MRLLLLCAFIGGCLGCISNSVKFRPGQMWTEQEFIAKTCTKKGDREVVEIRGCYKDPITIPIGSNRTIKGVQYACKLISNGRMVLYRRQGNVFRAAKSGHPKGACYDVDWKRHRKGEEWVEGGMFKMRCGDNWRKEAVGCVKNGVEMPVNGGAVGIASGYGTFLWRCLRASQKDVKLCAHTNLRDLDTVEDEPVTTEVNGTCKDHLGKEHHHGETWIHEKLAVSCLKGPDGKLDHVVIGCMKGDIVIPINGERNINNVTWVCVIRPRGIIQLGIKGQLASPYESTPTCEDVNGGQHSAGERWVEGTFKKICAFQNGTASPETIGCLKDPHSMTLDGQAATESEEWLCKTVSPSGEVQLSTQKGPSTTPGCYDTSGVKREEGDEWVAGSFKMRCLKSGEGSDEPKIVACVLKEQEIPVNYQKVIDNQTWYCLASPYGAVTLMTTDTPPKGEPSQSEAQPSPLSRCYDLSGKEHAYGDEWKTRSYKLRCESNNNGGNQTVVTACIKDDVEIPINEEKRIGDTTYKCISHPPSDAELKESRNSQKRKCTDSSGKEHDQEEEWIDEGLKWICALNEDLDPNAVILACIKDGVEIPVDSTAQFGDKLYKCKLLPNGSATVEPVTNKPGEDVPAPVPICVDSAGRNRSEGEEWKEEAYKVKCTRDEQGKLRTVSIACIMDETEIPVNSTAQKGDRLYECKLLPNGSATVEPVTNKHGGVVLEPVPICVDSAGRNRSVGEEWKEEAYKVRVKCTTDEQGEVFIVHTACIVDDTEIPVNSTAQKGDGLYECKLLPNGSARVEPVTLKPGEDIPVPVPICVDSTGRNRSEGEEWKEEAYKVKCTRDEQGKLHTVSTACIMDETEIPVNSTAQKGDRLYECKLLPNGSATVEPMTNRLGEDVPAPVPICVDSAGRNRSEGEEWKEGSYKVKCTRDEKGVLHFVPTACIMDEAEIPVNSEMIREGDPTAWKCVRQPDKELQLKPQEITKPPAIEAPSLPEELQPIRCINFTGHGEKILHFGKTWNEGPYKHQCLPDDEHYILPKVVACVLNGTEIAVGNETLIGDQMLECKRLANGTASIEPVTNLIPFSPNCTDSKGETHEKEEQWIDGELEMECVRGEDGSLKSNVISCVRRSTHIPIGGEGMIDGKVWECQLQSNNSVIFRPKLEQSAIPAPSECMDSLENEFYLGETWVDGAYEKKCVMGDDGKLHAKVLYCIKDGVLIHVGAKKYIDDELWECKRLSEYNASLEILSDHEEPTPPAKPGQLCTDSSGIQHQENEEWAEGDVQMKCVPTQDGTPHPKPIACIKDDIKIPVGGVLVKGDSVWKCNPQPSGQLPKLIQSEFTGEPPAKGDDLPPLLSPSKCITDYGEAGKVYHFGKKWIDGPYKFKCVHGKIHYIRPIIIGCVKDGDVIAVGGEKHIDGKVWKCARLSNNSVQLLPEEQPKTPKINKPPSNCTDSIGGTHSEDEEWIDGSLKYKCGRDDSGRILPKVIGCVKDGEEIPVGDSKRIGDAEWKCKLLTPDSARLTPMTRPELPKTAASPSNCTDSLGKTHSEGDEWTDETFIMKCVRDEDGNLRPKGTYCLRNDIKIPVNGMMMTTPKEETAWKCEPATTGAKPRLAPVPATEVPKINDTDLAEDARLSKCVKVYRNGVKIFNIGKEWTDGQFKLSCTVDDEHHLRPAVVACVKDGKEVPVGTTVEIDGKEFHCETLPDSTTTPIPKQPIQPPDVPEESTCVDIDDVNHEPGEEWILRGFKKRCVVDPEGNQRQKVITACLENTIEVSVGGVMVKGNEEWHCAKKPTGEITFEQKPFTTGEEPLAPPRNTTSRMCFTDYGNGVKVFSFNRVWIEDGVQWTCVHHPKNTIMEKAVGCVKDGVEIPVAGQAEVGDKQWECRRLRNGKAGLRPMIDDFPMPDTCFDSYGNEHKDGEEWDSPSYRWVCTPDEDADLVPSVAACLMDGTVIPMGAEMEKNGNVWECKPSGETPELIEKPPIPPPSSSAEDKPGPLRPNQCVTVHPNGTKVYNFGSEWIDGSLKYKCVRSEAHHILPEIVGCVKDFVEIPMGYEKRIGDMEWQCIGQPDGTATLTPKDRVEPPPVRHPVASEPQHTCTDSLGEQHEKGEEWTEGEFKIQCIEDESGTPQRVLTACIKDEVEVPVGEEVNINGKMWQCTGQPDGTAVLTAKKMPAHHPISAYQEELPQLRSPPAPGPLCTDSNGATREEGEEWTEGALKIQCVEDENGIPHREVTACIKDGVEIPVGGEKRIGDKVWQCRGQPDGTVALTAKKRLEPPPTSSYDHELPPLRPGESGQPACMDSNGTMREEGEEWTEAGFKRKCVMGVSGTRHQEIVACIKDKIEVPVGGVMVKGNAEWHCAKQPNGAVTFKPKPMASGEEPLKSPTYWASLICITDYGNGAKVFNFNKEWIEDGVKWKCVHDRKRIILPKAIACKKDGVEILLGDEAKIGNTKWECRRLPNGEAGIRPMPGGLRLSTTCTDYYGTKQQDGEEWNTGAYRMKCMPDEHGNVKGRAIGCWKEGVLVPLGAEMEMNGKLWECTESGSIADLISKPPIPPSIGNHEDTMALIRQSQCVVVYPSGAKVFRFGRVWIDGSFKFKCDRDKVHHILPKVLACVKNSVEIPVGSEKRIDGKVWQCVSQLDGMATLAAKYTAEAPQKRMAVNPTGGPPGSSYLPTPIVSGPGSCEDSKGMLHEEGEEWVENDLKMLCILDDMGHPIPTTFACVKNEEEIAVGEEKIIDGKKYECAKLPNGKAELRTKDWISAPSASRRNQQPCLPDGCCDASGNGHKLGEQWNDGAYSMVCTRDPSGTFLAKVRGCVRDGVEIPMNEKQRIGGYVWSCAMDEYYMVRMSMIARRDGPPSHTSCTDAHGEEYNEGEDWVDQNFRRVCVQENATYTPRIIACVQDKQEILLGAAKKVNGQLWHCDSRDDGYVETWSVMPSYTNNPETQYEYRTCFDTHGKLYNVGDRWVDGMFRMSCVGNEHGGSTMQVVGCVKDNIDIAFNTEKTIGGMRWKCRALDDGSYQLMAVDENIDTFPKVCHDEMGKVHQNGQEWIEKGMFKMKCTVYDDGSFSVNVVACITGGTTLEVGKRRKLGGVEWMCRRNENGIVELVQVSPGGSRMFSICVDGNHKRRRPGEVWVESGMFRIECKGDQTNGYNSEITACLKDGHEIPVGGKGTIGGITYYCTKKGNGGVSFTTTPQDGSSRGLIPCQYEGKTYKPGAEWITGKFKMRCTSSDRMSVAEAIGCIVAGQEIAPNATKRIGMYVYNCTKTGSGSLKLTSEVADEIPCENHPYGSVYWKGNFKLKCAKKGTVVLLACRVGTVEIPANQTKHVKEYGSKYRCVNNNGVLSLSAVRGRRR